MLINIDNMIINTQSITTVSEDKGFAVVRFVGGVPKNVVLSVSLNDFIKYLEDVGATIHG